MTRRHSQEATDGAAKQGGQSLGTMSPRALPQPPTTPGPGRWLVSWRGGKGGSLQRTTSSSLDTAVMKSCLCSLPNTKPLGDEFLLSGEVPAHFSCGDSVRLQMGNARYKLNKNQSLQKRSLPNPPALHPPRPQPFKTGHMDRRWPAGLVSTGSAKREPSHESRASPSQSQQPSPALSNTHHIPPHPLSHGMAWHGGGRPLAWSDPHSLVAAPGPAGSFPLGLQQEGHLLRQPPGSRGEAREPRQTSPATGSMGLTWDGLELGRKGGGWRSQLVGRHPTILEGIGDWRRACRWGLIMELCSLRILGSGPHLSPDNNTSLRGQLCALNKIIYFKCLEHCLAHRVLNKW